jgi:hypothetical protein
MEKKMETLQKESDEKNGKLQQSFDEFKQTTAKIEKYFFQTRIWNKSLHLKQYWNNPNREHLETIEAIQQEIESLQNEKRDLKEKLRQHSKRSMMDGILSRQTSETPKSSQK